MYFVSGSNYTQLYSSNIVNAKYIPNGSGCGFYSVDCMVLSMTQVAFLKAVTRFKYLRSVVIPSPLPHQENKQRLREFTGGLSCDPPPPQSSSSMTGASTQDRDGNGD